MNLVRVFIFIFGICFFQFSGAGVDVDIIVSDVFYEGDEISFTYSFISSQDEVIDYVANVNCPDSYEVVLNLKQASLVADEYFQGDYSYGVVDENVNLGECTASVLILEPYLVEFTEIFEVVTLDEFSFSLDFCKSADCVEKAKVFNVGEDLYLDYVSDVSGLDMSAVLVYPDGFREDIGLPLMISVSQVGTYDLEVEVLKEGYNTVSFTEQFGVIEGDFVIEEHNFSSSVRVSDVEFDWGLVLIGGVLVLVFVVFLVWWLFRG